MPNREQRDIKSARSAAPPKRRGKAAQSTAGGPRRSLFRRIKGGFEQHQSVAVESLQRLLQHPGGSALTWSVIGIALALPLCLFVLLYNLQQLGSSLDQASRMSVFLEADVAPARAQAMAQELRQRDDLVNVELVTPSEALVEFQTVSGFGEALTGLEENPLPAVLLVDPVSRDGRELEALLREFQSRPEVDLAQLDLQWLERLYGIIDLSRRLTLSMAVLLCLGVVLVIGNTVRLAIEGRRAEIVVVKLVGGTDSYVARPFLYAGLWYGVGGGLLAWLVVQLGLWGLQAPVSRLAGLYNSSFSLRGLDMTALLLILLGSGTLGWLGAQVSVLRHLRHIEPR